MSSFTTIKCGASHQQNRRSRRPSSCFTLSGYMPKTMPEGSSSYAAHTRVEVLKRDSRLNNKFSALVVETSFKKRAISPQIISSAPQGSWRNKLTVTDSTSVKHKPSQPINRMKSVASPGRKLTRPCAYCHDEEDIHHIRDCSVLEEKNHKKSEFSRNHKDKKRQVNLRVAEARIAEQVRFAQLEKETTEVEEDTSESEVESDEEFPALTATIASGHVTVNRVSSWGASRQVTFNDDSQNLMKPPCEIKVFNTRDTPISISDEEEEEIILKPSAGAWKPRRSRTSIPSKEHKLILDDIKDKEEELASYSIDSWADACEIEELEKDIKALKAKLA